MSKLGQLTIGLINSGLDYLIKMKGEEDYDLAISSMKATGEALVMLSTKLKDREITESELEGILTDIEKKYGEGVLLGVKSALSRILEGLYSYAN